ncbi:MAG: TolC family protein [Phycisphaeraceae bacterium]|nr:TolC family protein [Phycisphaeraceae bacterium]
MTRNTARTPRCARRCAKISAAWLCIAAGCAAGCQVRSVTRDGAASLREAVIAQSKDQLADAGQRHEPKQVSRTPSQVRFNDERLRELNAMAGPQAHDGSDQDGLGLDLLGAPATSLPVTLDEAVRSAVASNLDIQTAQLNPALGSSQLIAAQAAFDWTLFADANLNRTHRPQTVPVLNGVALGSSVSKNESFAFDAGLRRQLTTGGLVELSQSLTVTNNKTPGFAFNPDPAHDAALNLTLSQPLLRGFGENASLAEIRLAESQRRADALRLQSELLRVIDQTVNAYWDLALAHYRLQVDRSLLDRGVQTRDVLGGRLDFDVRPAEYSDAVARVESRRAAVLRDENALRLASDRLKQLLNDPELPVSGETILLAADPPIDEPIAFDLVDALNTALAARPEIELALSTIEDAAIREAFAANAKLPQLDLTFQVGLNGLDSDTGGALSEEGEADFINYTAGLAFERAIGNRAADATLRLRRLERLQSVIAHRSAVQQIIVEVKAALRNVDTNYRLIEQTRAARLAAAENLRTLQVEEETTQAMTPAFLNLKLTRQEALAAAEIEEAAALTDYLSSIADLNSAMGVALQRHGLEVVIPDDQTLDGMLDTLDPIGD